MVGEMSVRGNVLVEKCPVGEVSFREVSGRGIVRSGKRPVGKLSYNRRRQCIVFLNSLVLHFRENLLECLSGCNGL